MKHLTAFLTVIAIVFSLSASVWAKAEAPNEAVPPAAEPPVTLSASGEGTVNPGGSTVAENGGDAVIDLNEGVVETNNGSVGTNTGTVVHNTSEGTVTENGGTVVVNNGTVINSGFDGAAPEVTFNTGEVVYSGSPDEVAYNAGEVYTEYPHGDGFDRTSYYGIVYANELGDGLLLPCSLCEQLLADGADAESVLSELVKSGDVIFTEAVSDSGNPAQNGVITLLTAAEAAFLRSGYSLEGWMDANQNNTPYAFGETVTVTAPLWLIPRWVLISDPSSAEESEPVAPSAHKAGTIILVPAAGSSTWNLPSITFISSDERVTADTLLPSPALMLSSDLADILRSSPLNVEFDGELLPARYFSLSFRQDGTVVLLFSSTFIRTLEDGEHDIVLYLNDTVIDVTMLLTESTPEDASLHARKTDFRAESAGASRGSANSQKGNSG